MEECTFAPQINRKKVSTTKIVNQNQRGFPALEAGYEPIDEGVEDEEEPRDVDTFVADQNRFLIQKRMKEEARKLQQQMEEEEKKSKVTMVNKRSLQLLQEREQRLRQNQ